jgi:hypothetical protein
MHQGGWHRERFSLSLKLECEVPCGMGSHIKNFSEVAREELRAFTTM